MSLGQVKDRSYRQINKGNTLRIKYSVYHQQRGVIIVNDKRKDK